LQYQCLLHYYKMNRYLYNYTLFLVLLLLIKENPCEVDM
jgi:hypothetical protein